MSAERKDHIPTDLFTALGQFRQIDKNSSENPFYASERAMAIARCLVISPEGSSLIQKGKSPDEISDVIRKIAMTIVASETWGVKWEIFRMPNPFLNIEAKPATGPISTVIKINLTRPEGVAERCFIETRTNLETSNTLQVDDGKLTGIYTGVQKGEIIFLDIVYSLGGGLIYLVRIFKNGHVGIFISAEKDWLKRYYPEGIKQES